MRILLSLIIAGLSLPALAQAPSPAQMGITPPSPTQQLEVLDSNKAWAPLGTVDPTSHTFTPWASTFTPPGQPPMTLQQRGLFQVFVGDYGASGSAQTTSGSIAAASVTLNLLAAKDFANGQGVAVPTAGGTFSAGAPTISAVVPTGGGTTVYCYEVASVDAAGGYGVATAASCANANTVLDAKHFLTLSVALGASAPGYAIWRQVNGGAWNYVNASASLSYVDTGYCDGGTCSATNGAKPSFLPNSPPTAAQNDWCVEPIVSGGGTTALTLAAACPNAATSVVVRHDDTAAINTAISANSAGAAVMIPCGTYNISSSINWVKANNIVLYGHGRCANIAPWGAEDIFYANGAGPPQLYGNGVFNLAVAGNNQLLGKALNFNWAAKIQLSWLIFNGTCDGLALDNTTDGWITHIRMNNPTCQGITDYLWTSDVTGGSWGIIDATDLQAAGNAGNANPDLTTSSVGFKVTGNVDTVICRNCDATHIAGTSLLVTNDVGNPSPPAFVMFSDFGAEYPTSRNVDIEAGIKISLINPQLHAAGFNNFVSCASSSDVYYNTSAPGSSLTITGGMATGASGDGIYLGGVQAALAGMQAFSNSNPGQGGVAGQCPGVEFGPASASSIISGAVLGSQNNPTWQQAPAIIDAGAVNNLVGHNTFVGNVFNHVIDQSAGGSGNLVACNAGSDVNDCTGPSSVYVGPGDLGLNGLVTFAGLRCVSNAYAGNVADVWDAATGVTTETLLTCSPGGFINQTVNQLSITCASGCVVAALYDQKSTNDFTQATNALRPALLQTNCGYAKHNSYPWCLQFSGSQYLKTGTVTAIAQPLDMGLVAQRTAVGASPQYALTLAGGVYLSWRASVPNSALVSFGTSAIVSGIADNAWHSFLAEGNGATGAYQVDATLQGAQNLGVTGGSTGWSLGATTAGANPFTGLVASLMVTSAANGPNAAASLFPLINRNQHSYWGF